MIGTIISGRFQIIREVGRGGMGVVYLAKDQLLDREVAIKFMSPTSWNQAAEERFKREARIVARMDHASIVTLFDIGKHEASLYIVMPYVPGTSLRSRMESGTLRIKDAIDVGIQISEALEYSHAAGVIHRDIKPENILIQPENPDAIRVRVTDFGLARSTGENRLTQSGALVGTVEYLSPEQVQELEIDGRSDIYSLGVVLYECFVGRTPFTGEIHNVVYRLAHDEPSPPRSLGIDIPEDLEEIILLCLEKDPLRRPQKASELAARLIRLRSEIGDRERLCSALIGPQSLTKITRRQASDPMIGRSAQLTELMHRLNVAISGECQFVLVTGDSGIGKSRLLQELENLARARRIHVLYGRFADLYQAFPYQGFADLIREYLHEKRISRSFPDFSDLSADLLRLFPMLGEFDAFKTSSQLNVTKFEDKTAIFELLARTITRISDKQPLVIFLEDLQAASASIEALHYIAQRLAATPTLIVGAARTTELEKGHPLLDLIETMEGDRRFLHIPLAPLTPKEHQSLVELLCGNKSLDSQFLKNIFQATDGNPYFTRELLQSLADANAQTLGELAGSGELPAARLPSTIQQAVTRRIERLSERSREVLSLISVLGRVFDYHDLEALAGNDAEEVVDSLVQTGLLEEDRESRGERLAFSSGLLREVLYSGLPPRKRRSFHRKFAEYLEQRFEGRLERIYPELIHHFSEADVRQKVVDYGLKFARQSLSAFSEQDAFRTAQTVLKFLKDAEIQDPSLEVETRRLLAESHRMAGRWEQAIQEIEEVIQLLSQQKKGILDAILFLVETAWLARKVDTMRLWAERGIELARVSGENAVLEKLLSLAGTAANLRAEYDRAQEFIAELESLRRRHAIEDEEQVPAGGTLMIGLSAAVHAKHPGEMQIDEENEILANVFETLLTTDAQGALVPMLCARWEPLDGGHAFLFTIHDDILMHGGGKLTSSKIKAGWERSIRKCAKSLPAAFSAIRGVTEFLELSADHVDGILAFSELKLGIQLLEKLPTYPAMLSDMRTAVAAPKGKTFSGTGPYVITSFQPSHVILHRYERYWRLKAILDGLDFKCSQSAREIADGFRAGRFDLVRDLPDEEVEEMVKRRRSRARVAEAARKNVYYALLNQNAEFLTSQEAGKALTASVRTHDLCHTTLGRSVQPAESLLPPGIFCFDPGRRRAILPQDQARESLSGLLPLKLRVAAHPLFQDRYGALTKALFRFWSELGVEASIVTPDMSSYLERVSHSEGIDLILGRWIADYDDPDSFAYGLFDSKQGSLRNYYSSTIFDGMIEEARTEISPERRDHLYRRIEDHLVQSGLFLPLFHEVHYRVCSAKVKRLRLSNVPPYVNYSEIGKLESSPQISVRRSSGGMIQVPLARKLPSMDPSLAFLEVSGEVLPAVFETLIQYEEGARTVPLLAAEFSAEDHSRRFYFRLRDHVLFHNGRTLTARDVRYTFERLLKNPNSKSRSLLLPIRGAAALYSGEKDHLDGFRILSPLEFVVELEQVLSFFPALLTFPATSIVAEGSDPTSRSWLDGCVGTGPYRLTRFDEGERANLEANPSYWRKGYPRNEGLTFHFGVSPSEIAAGFKNARFSVASDLLPEDVELLRREPDLVEGYREIPRLSTEYLAFNIHRSPLDSEVLRQQLVKAVDVRAIVRRKLGRLGIPAEGFLPPGLLGHESMPSWKFSSPTTNPHLGIRLTACISPRHQGRYAGVAEEIFQAWEKLGVQVDVVHPTETKYGQILNSPDVDLTVTGWTADYPDPDTFLHGAIHSEQGADGRFCGIKEIDQLSATARSESDPDTRHALYREMEKLIANRAILLPLFHEQTYRFARPDVQNLKLNYFFPAVAYDALWIKK